MMGNLREERPMMQNRKPLKVALICSHGGHYTETMQIVDAFDDCEIFWATYHSSRSEEVRAIAPAYFTHNIGLNPLRMAYTFAWSLFILLKERPHVVISLGAEIALPFLLWAKLLGSHTIFIESWCRTVDLSLTARLVRPFVDDFWVQWPQLVEIAGPKADYHGAVI